MTERAPPDVQFMHLQVPGDSDSWPERMDAACRALERRFGIELTRAHSGTKHHVTTHEVKDRLKYFSQRLRTKYRWFSLAPLKRPHTDEPDSRAALKALSFGGTMYGGGEIFNVGCTFEPSTAFDEPLLVELGDAMRAHSSAYTPSRADWRLRLAHRCATFGTIARRPKLADRLPEEESLPLMRESLYEGLAPLQPHHVGWVNYWSQQVCDYVGFPGNLEGSPILQHCYQTPAGAWIVKLGTEPFERRNIAHLKLLNEMYQRFPRVGVRLPVGIEIAEYDLP
jgi:Family of unknown function (DUF5953)